MKITQYIHAGVIGLMQALADRDLLDRDAMAKAASS